MVLPPIIPRHTQWRKTMVRVSTAVLEGIQAVQKSGLTNMLIRHNVGFTARAMGFSETADWIRDHRVSYFKGICEGFEEEDDAASS